MSDLGPYTLLVWRAVYHQREQWARRGLVPGFIIVPRPEGDCERKQLAILRANYRKLFARGYLDCGFDFRFDDDRDAPVEARNK